MTLEPQPATDNLPARATARTRITQAVSRLRSAFPAPRMKRVLKVAVAPLLLTTALASDIVKPADAPTTVWSHSSYTTTFTNARGVAFQHTPAADSATATPPSLTCYRPQADERHPLLALNSTAWRGFYDLSRSGPYSRALHQSARDLELSICESKDDALVRNYDTQNRLAGISTNGNLPLNIREAAHGITHALMQQRNLSAPSADEALFSRLNRHLTAEAIALTSEYIVAAEMQAAGDEALMRTLVAENHPALRYFKTAFDVSHARNPDNLRATIDDAAGATITFLLRQRAFVEANSDVVLRAYLAELLATSPRPRSSSDFDATDLREMGKVGRRSFSADARILSAQELAIVSPDTTHLVEALQRLHAQHNRYRAPRTTLQDNPYVALTNTAVQKQFTNSGGAYTVRQAFERARYSATYKYKEREWQLGESFRYGMQSDYTREQTPQNVRPMHEQLTRLRTLSPTIGPAMIDYAARANIVMCYGELKPNTLGQWQADSGIIVMAQAYRNDAAGNTRIIAHELTHLMQTASGIADYTSKLSIEDLQTSSLTREAAASTVSVLIAMEFKLSGDDSLWNFGDEQGFADTMLQIYTQSRQGGASHSESLEAAGLEGYHLMFSRQWWLDTYNGYAARDALKDIASGWFKAPSTKRYPVENIQRTGRVSDAFNFTRNVTQEPTDQMRFGTNDEMRHLFAYLHLQQLRKNLGENHESVVAQRNLMQENKNPYLDVNFDELVAHYNAHKTRPVMFVMNYLSGRTARPEIMPEPTRTPPPQPRVPSCK